MKQLQQVTSSISRAKKLKLFCRFNGQFHRRPPYNMLRYVGGETRIITVEKNLTFLKLVTRIYQLCPNLKPFCLKYKLVLSNINSDWDPPLVSIECDDDVKRMIEGFEGELIELYGQCGNNARLWLFVCSSDDFGAKKNSSCGSDVKGSDGIRCCLGSDVPSIDLRDELSDQRCGDSAGREKLGKGETFGDFVNCVVGPSSRPLNPKDGNLMHCCISRQKNGDYADLCSSRVVSICDDVNGKQALSNNGQGFINNVNRENIMPWGTENPWSYRNQIDGSNYRVKNPSAGQRVNSGTQREGLHEARNHQIYTYQIQSQKNMFGVGKKNHRALCLDGRLSAGRYSGFRPMILSNSMKPDFPGNVADNRPSALNDASGVTEEQTNDSDSQSGQSNSTAYHTGIAVANQSLVCENDPRSMALPVRAMEIQHDRLTGSHSMVHNIPCQNASQSCRRVPMDSKPSMFVQKKNNGISDFWGNLYPSIETTQESNAKLINTSEGNNYTRCSNNGYDLQGGVASTVDLLYNSSLSSSKEVESSDLSSLACDVAFNTLLKSEIKPPNFLDERKACTSPKADYAAAITFDDVSRSGPNVQNDRMPEEEIQQDPPSGLMIDEQAETNNSIKGSKVIGGIHNDLAAFYTHLATKELQAIKHSDLEFVKELGSGTYGTVYHGKWKGSDVAVKKLKPSCFTGGSVEEDRLVADFWKEAHILGRLHHPNIVALYGVVTDGPANNLATVTEYMVNGSLRQVLRRKDRTIDRRKRLIIAMDAAFGMEYLHEKNIVHFDLKSHNLLVNMKDPQRPTCKIGDLGLSKIKQRTLVSGGVRGTIPWMAPELFSSKNNMVTEKVDVYSFGMVMWELLTGEEPYANLRSEEIIGGIIKGTQRPEIPTWCDPYWRSLMVRCWSSDPNDRPSFSEIAKELRSMAVAMNIK